MTSQARWFLNPLFGEQYFNKVLGIQKADLIGHWPLNEGRNTTTPAPAFDGTNSYVNIYSASLNTAFSGSAGTFLCWAKVSGAGVWTDAAWRNLITLRVDASNYVEIAKSSTNNRLSHYE